MDERKVPAWMEETNPRRQPAVVDVAGLERRLSNLERRHNAVEVVLWAAITSVFVFELGGFATLIGFWFVFGVTKLVLMP